MARPFRPLVGAVLPRAMLHLPLLFVLAAPIAPAGETPVSSCFVAVDSHDTATPSCQLVSSLEYYGHGDCKPEIIAECLARRFGWIPEGCCATSISFEQAYNVRIAGGSGPAARSLPAVTSVPVVAYVRSELVAAHGGVHIQFPGWDQNVTFNISTPSFRDTLRGTVTIGSDPTDGNRTRDISQGQVYLAVGVQAEVCNQVQLGPGDYVHSRLVIDPFIEVDPTSPLAADYHVEKETEPGSGVYVPMVRDTTTVLFSEVTVGTLVETSGATGLAWGDIDGDGDLDLFDANSSNTSCRLFRNEGGGTFTDVTTADLALPFGYNMQPTWADIDNDGDLDLYMTRGMPPEKHVLMRNDGTGTFARDSASALCFAGYGRAATWADYDRDGDLDVFVAQCGGGSRLMRNDGTGHFTNATPAVLADAGCDMCGVWGDYDGDGDLDLFRLTNSGSSRAKLVRNDLTTFTDVTPSSLLPVSELTTAFSGEWVDFDDDQRPDLVVVTSAGNRLFRNLGNGGFVDSTTGWIAYGGAGSNAAWGDLDLDGDLDCYLSNRTNPNRVVVRFGNHFGCSMFHVGGPIDAPGIGTCAAWADVDDDGDLDLYAGYIGFRRMLRNDQALGNHWLAVDLAGIDENRFGVGARVRVVSGGRSQSRWVLGSSLRGGQPLRQTFGLGQASTVDTLEVRWPRGPVTTLAGPFTADRRVTVRQDGTVLGVSPGGASMAARLLGPAPNPFGTRTAIRFQLPRPMRVEIGVYDVAGRRVRTLRGDEPMPAGIGALEWDGRTDAGDATRPGVYFCRMSAGGVDAGRSAVLRLVRVH